MHVKNLIIGTGAGSVATAMALRRKGLEVDVIDVGFSLPEDVQAQVEGLASQEPGNWDRQATDGLFPIPIAGPGGVRRRLSFGSDFPYRDVPYLSVRREDCEVEVSHGLGGFGNVWGAAVLPYTDQDLADWPIESSDLASSYKRVVDYMPISGESDDLEHDYPLHVNEVSALKRSAQVDFLIDALHRRRESLAGAGIQFGRARVAVDSQGGDRTCRYCGYCLDGCVYGSIFNPGNQFAELEGEGVSIHKGYYALEFHESAGHVRVTAINTRDHSMREWTAKRIFLGAGQLSTTRILARSLRLQGVPIRVLDSQYFFFPFFSYRAHISETRFTLAEIFLETLNASVSPNRIHLQLYGRNPIFEHVLARLVPVKTIARRLLARLYLAQGFLHSNDSGQMMFTLDASKDTKDDVTIRGLPNRAVGHIARKVQSILRRELIGSGLVPPVSPKPVEIGRSFHSGGSFPMGASHPVFASDLLGRPSGLRRVHIVDAASFPSIPGSPILFSIMANADRIVSAAA